MEAGVNCMMCNIGAGMYYIIYYTEQGYVTRYVIRCQGCAIYNVSFGGGDSLYDISYAGRGVLIDMLYTGLGR